MLQHNFLGIQKVSLDKAQVVILPVPFERTTSYGKGTKNGPNAILKASQEVELYNSEYGDEIQDLVKIATVKPVSSNFQAISMASAKHLDKFLISLGGEHSVTPALVRPWLKKYRDLSILQIDAHTDMRNSYEDNKNSHACAMRRLQEMGISKIIQVGIRNTAKEEQQYLKKENIFWGNKFEIQKILSRLSDNVYLTFDVDGLDPSIMPATGTPEPGGLSYEQALELMGNVIKNKNLVAADFVELSPISKIPAYDFIVAKLIYELIGHKFILYRTYALEVRSSLG